MKILFVIHGFPPDQMAGSELYTFLIAKELSKKDEVTVLARGYDHDLREYALCRRHVGQFNLITINNTYKYRKSYTDKYENYQISFLFQQLLSEFKPDIVHIGHLIGLSTTFVDDAKKKNIPVVYTLHDFWLICPTGRFIKSDSTICYKPDLLECKKCLAPQLLIGGHSNSLIRAIKRAMNRSGLVQKPYARLEKSFKFLSTHYVKLNRTTGNFQLIHRRQQMQKIFRLTDCFIAPSRFLLKTFVSFGLSENKIIHLDYGFDTSIFKPIQRKTSATLRLGFIGTLIPPKGIHVLLNAFSKIDSKGVELRIHGDFDNTRDDYTFYSHAIRPFFKSSNIIWFGPYANQDLGKILCEIDILVVPSLWFENSPLVIHEAFLAKVPVLTSRAGGMQELVRHGVNGFLFELGNDEDLRKRLQKIVNQPGVLNTLKANIPKVTDIKEHACVIRNLYSQVINRKHDSKHHDARGSRKN